MMKQARVGGVVCAILVLVIDQFHKWWMLEVMEIATRPAVEVTSFFNLVMVWNRGVSFGMFSGMDAKWFLIGVAMVISTIVGVMLWRSTHRLHAVAYGLVIGGALGNVADRLRFGAVADFFDVHVMGYHWPAFNVADSAIFIGVALLLVDGLFGGAKAKSAAETSE